MKSTPVPVHRTLSYLFGALCFLLLGYLVKKYLVIFDDKVLISWQDSLYLSIAFPIWGANIIGGVLLFYMLLLLTPDLGVLRGQPVHIAVFIFLLLLCVLPLYRHFATERLNAVEGLPVGYSLILNSIGIVLCFRGLLTLRLSRIHAICTRMFQWGSDMRPRYFIIGLFASVVLICSCISWLLFDAVPGSYDSCMYMFQARLFSHGMLFEHIPPEPQFFANGLAILSDKWYTQFPPGYPAILAVGVLLRIPWLVNPILGALTIVGIYLIAKTLYDENIAKLSALLTAGSSFFLFM